MNAIGAILGLPRVEKGVGSSVHNDFITPMAAALGLEPTNYSNKYRRIEAVIERLGGQYDPFSDTSEGRPSGGGGTLTNAGLRKILVALEARQRAGLADAQEVVEHEGAFDPDDIHDARDRQLRAIAVRRGRARFRDELIRAYAGRCAVTGYDAVQSLEAAHIVPYRGVHTNTTDNGLLLRADIHTLFDLGCLGIDPDNDFRIVIDPALGMTRYQALAGERMQRPESNADLPRAELLRWHIHRWGLVLG